MDSPGHNWHGSHNETRRKGATHKTCEFSEFGYIQQMHTHTCMHFYSTSFCTRVHVYICMCTCMYKCLCPYTGTHTYAYTHTSAAWTYVDIHRHTHRHTQTHRSIQHTHSLPHSLAIDSHNIYCPTTAAAEGLFFEEERNVDIEGEYCR